MKPSHGFAIGQRVEARWVTERKTDHQNRNWYGGVITAQHSDGTYEVHYDDGDLGSGIAERHVERDEVMRALVDVRIAVAFPVDGIKVLCPPTMWL